MTFKDKEKQREYLRNHFIENREKYKIASSRSKRKLNIEIDLIKESKPCKDCGKWYPYYMMHFDHLRDKDFNIGEARYRLGRSKLLSEIQKCDLVCANCHSIRTHYSVDLRKKKI